MKGYVQNFSLQTKEGTISADDGRVFHFSLGDIASKELPEAGMRADFLTEGERAVEIYLLEKNPQMAHVEFYEDQPTGIKALFSAKGCFTRWQYWKVSLATFAYMMTLILLLVAVSDDTNTQNPLADAIIVLFVVSIFIVGYINIVTSIKRFHDINKSGWYYLITFVPYVGGIAVLIMNGFLPSVKENNRYCRRKQIEE